MSKNGAVRQDFAQLRKGKTNEIVAQDIGFGNKETYRQAKYIADNANNEMIKSLDEGGIETWKQYQNQKLKGYQIVS